MRVTLRCAWTTGNRLWGKWRKTGICLDHAAQLGDFELLLTANASGDGLELVADAGVFARETIQLMAAHLGAWLRAFASATGRIADIPLAPSGRGAGSRAGQCHGGGL